MVIRSQKPLRPLLVRNRSLIVLTLFILEAALCIFAATSSSSAQEATNTHINQINCAQAQKNLETLYPGTNIRLGKRCSAWEISTADKLLQNYTVTAGSNYGLAGFGSGWRRKADENITIGMTETKSYNPSGEYIPFSMATGPLNPGQLGANPNPSNIEWLKLNRQFYDYPDLPEFFYREARKKPLLNHAIFELLKNRTTAGLTPSQIADMEKLIGDWSPNKAHSLIKFPAISLESTQKGWQRLESNELAAALDYINAARDYGFEPMTALPSGSPEAAFALGQTVTLLDATRQGWKHGDTTWAAVLLKWPNGSCAAAGLTFERKQNYYPGRPDAELNTLGYRQSIRDGRGGYQLWGFPSVIHQTDEYKKGKTTTGFESEKIREPLQDIYFRGMKSNPEIKSCADLLGKLDLN